MSEIIKQEGEFKMNKPKKPRSLTQQDNITKVDLSVPAVDADVTKVVIPSLEAKEQETTEQEDGEVKEIIDTKTNDGVIEEISNEDVEVRVVAETNEPETIVVQAPSRELPENVEKLISFMEETGGTVEDYVRLNTDYSNVDEKTLLREYYSRTKPHLDKSEIEFLLEDNFEYDEDIEEERDIRKKKLAFKEEVAKAKNHLESIKGKYYDEIKLKPGVTKEQQEAFDFFNRYKKSEDESKLRHERFRKDTKNLFNNEFKGFEYNVGDKRFRYSVQNNEQLAEKQSDINNFIGKFLDKDGNVSDTGSYHKALYTAMNSDKIAQHFYEQGKADAVKEVMNNSKNPSLSQPRKTSGEVFINGLKVKSISGFDSSKLRIQTKKFNN